MSNDAEEQAKKFVELAIKDYGKTIKKLSNNYEEAKDDIQEKR